MSLSVQNTKKRFFYLDFLRALACLGVIMIHASGVFTADSVGSFDFFVCTVLGSVSRFAVPIFVMISGALMLEEQKTFDSENWIGHILKILFFFLFWSAFYAVVYRILFPLLTNEPIQWNLLLSSFFVGHFHLWFCYMIIGLYLIVPLLRLWVKKENVKWIRFFLLLGTAFTYVFPTLIQFCTLCGLDVSDLSSVVDLVNLKYVGGYLTYFVAGWYFHNFETKHKKTRLPSRFAWTCRFHRRNVFCCN